MLRGEAARQPPATALQGVTQEDVSGGDEVASPVLGSYASRRVPWSLPSHVMEGFKSGPPGPEAAWP